MANPGACYTDGALRAAALLKVPQNIIGLIPATENLPSGKATKPGDVHRAMNGKTAEIINTDAEGRLILGDALAYAARYKPIACVDLATLTGACVIALGHEAIGMMGNAQGEDLMTACAGPVRTPVSGSGSYRCGMNIWSMSKAMSPMSRTSGWAGLPEQLPARRFC